MAGTALDPGDAELMRREQLIRATIDSIADVGFAACTLGEIAKRAGVSPGLFAHYFGDKEGLLEATLRSMAARLGRAAAARLHAARASAGSDPGRHRRQPGAGGIRPAHEQRMAGLLGPGHSFGPLQAGPEHLPAPHALEPPACPQATRPRPRGGIDRHRCVRHDRWPLAARDPVRRFRARQPARPLARDGLRRHATPVRPKEVRNDQMPQFQPPRFHGSATISVDDPSIGRRREPSCPSTPPRASPSRRSRLPARRRLTRPWRRPGPVRRSGGP